MNYAKKIKELRDKKLLTQRDLANLLNVGIANISRWENGLYEPTMRTKRKLKELFIEAGIKEDN